MGDSEASKARYENIEDPKLDKLVREVLDEFHSPGLAIAIIHNGKVKAKGYGYADLEEKVPVEPETLFCCASTTKSFTSAIAGGLVESPDHPTTWQTPLAELIRDDFVLDQRSASGQWATNHVTLEDALSHRTGLPRHDQTWINGTCSDREVVRSLRFLPMHNELRAKWEYCNVPYTAVSHAIETVTGVPFKELLHDHIFNPLGMLNTTYSLTDARKLCEKDEKVRLARAHLWKEASHGYECVSWDDIPPAHGSGGIISNVLDYTQWMKHLMVPQALNHVLSKNVVDALRKPRMLVEKNSKRPWVGPEAYCLGLYSRVYRGRENLSHTGGIAGYMSNMLMVPPTAAEMEKGETGWAVVLFQNSYSMAHEIIVQHLLDDYLETPEQERFDTPRFMREARKDREAEFKEDAVVKKLFGEKAMSSHIPPSLPVQRFEGVYQHPAYHAYRLSMSKPARHATLHHVSGDFWWAHQCMGPSTWITDEALKVQFVVGADGEVKGMRFQAEPAMQDELAFFLKVE
ncbi:hypothetical protein CERZMDRAFT_110557 [Cercospora zeae-maydis SCOH1-5]|uniref:Beta-lactamase-related domain-containing protein n=1 Tax=Cercospora zeae-maydis SCOH1-5 TaxID=717836 RepID=A0A6A6FNU1_9PEZI|nr:hypothetical protein CERZMDRAFT_110557 [Cercospora zeae-maydis SCOH1-5]